MILISLLAQKITKLIFVEDINLDIFNSKLAASNDNMLNYVKEFEKK